MNARLHWFLSIVFIGQLCGCTKIKEPRPFPGFESSPVDSLALVRESNHIFLRAVDQKKYYPPPIVLDMGETYRQYQIPAGKHELTVFYEYGEITSDDLTIPALLDAGHTYYFKAEVDKFFVNFGTLSTGKWRPLLLDDTSIRTLPSPTTSPSQ